MAPRGDESMAPREQQIYARWLQAGTRIGLGLLVSTFTIYALALLEPLVSHQRLAELWTLPVDRYIAATSGPTGWNWLRFLGKGDYLNFVGIALLSLVTVACYARLLAALLRDGLPLQAAVAALQIAVLLAAALY
jgi:hypothetical protein